jgi:hypothetical protein
MWKPQSLATSVSISSGRTACARPTRGVVATRGLGCLVIPRGSSVQHAAGCGSGGRYIWLGVNSVTRHVQVELEDDDADSSCAILLVRTSVIAPLLSLGPKHGWF